MKKCLLFVAFLLSASICFAQGGTTSSDFYPATTGQNLGNTSQRWNVYGYNLDISGTTNFSGGLTVSGAFNVGSLTATGAVTAASAALSGALTSGSATVSGALTTGSATVSGTLNAGAAAVTGTVSSGSVSTGAVTSSGTIVSSSAIQGTQFNIGANPVLQDNNSTLSVGTLAQFAGTLNTYVGYDAAGVATAAANLQNTVVGNRAMASQNMPGTGGVVTFDVAGSVISACHVVSGGSGYTGQPWVDISTPNSSLEANGAISVTIAGGAITACNIDASGSAVNGTGYATTIRAIEANVAVGYASGRGLSDGTSVYRNIFIGNGAGQLSGNNIIGNVLIGSSTGSTVADTKYDTYVGDNAGVNTTQGGSNSGFGRAACNNVTSGNYNFCGGHAALYFVSGHPLAFTNGIDSGSYNTAVGGSNPGYGDQVTSFAAIDTAKFNTFYGSFTGMCSANAAGISRVALGAYSCSEGNQYAAIGTRLSTPLYALNTFSSSYSSSIRTATTTDPATVQDSTILCNGTYTETLPASPRIGEIFTFKNISAAATCTLSGNGHNIDAAATLVITTQNQSRQIQYDGTVWQIIAGYL